MKPQSNVEAIGCPQCQCLVGYPMLDARGRHIAALSVSRDNGRLVTRQAGLGMLCSRCGMGYTVTGTSVIPMSRNDLAPTARVGNAQVGSGGGERRGDIDDLVDSLHS